MLVSNNLLHSLLLLCAVLVILGCTGKQVGDSEEKMTEVQWTARHYRDLGLEYDNQHQMRLAELYYRKSYEILNDEPSQDWLVYGEAGYRYACMLYQCGDTEGALAVINEILDKAEGQNHFPATIRSGLLSLMAQCQLHLAMPEAAKQTFAKAYQNELTVLGGEEKGDFNLAIMCSNIFLSFFEIGEYDEAERWLDRYECEILACEKLGIGDSALIEEQKGSIALYKARYLQATGRMGEAAAVYAAIPRSRIFVGANTLDAIGYLMAAGRYDEAANWYDQLDSTFLATIGTETTFDNIATCLSPRYSAYRKAGRTDEALVMADNINAAIDSALVHQKKSDAAELAVIYQTHERELALEESEAKSTVYRILAFSLLAIIIVIFVTLWRFAIAHRRELIKNRGLFDLIQREQRREVRDIQRLARQPEQERTPGEQIFLRLVNLMTKEQPYTDAELNRDTLATMLATNHRYIDEAIRECSDALSTNTFINGYRVDHAARLLTQTDEPIALIAEMSGFANRTTFNEQFRSRYKMTPSEYRKAAKA
ncbi:MAG: helix-turn-helix domain-containing protein [Bacteroidales bacterium]|nr:helix-turn-helix domain-containing protein [Bacteroidales bacterium]